MSTKYTSYFHNFTASHYVKKLVKKYSQKQWDITERALLSMTDNIEVMLQTAQVETIHENAGNRICKVYFKIAGTKDTYKSSCCQSIVYVDTTKKEVIFLLIYHKSNIVKFGNETVAWQKIITKEFPQYSKLIN